MPGHRSGMKRIEPGTAIAGYRIDSLIGRGGMGAVYRASQLSLSRTVAIKILPGGGGGCRPEKMERFLREARVAAQLNHSNVIQIIDAGRDGEIYFIAMEYVKGDDLNKLVRKHGPLPPRICLAIAIQASRGLMAAWEKLLIHRDIKPDNIIVTPAGVVKIADFGLAKEAASSLKLTKPGSVIGTPAYMSPEQARGGKVDIRSDIYSLGATLHFCATGSPPFHGATALETIHKVVDTAPPSLADRAPSMPAEFRAVVEKMMEKSPDARFRTPFDVHEALTRLPGSPGPGPGAETPVLPATGDLEAGLTLNLDQGADSGDEGYFARFAAETVDGEENPPCAADQAGVNPVLRIGPPVSRKVFIFTGSRILFGRKESVEEEGESGRIGIILRALPCRSKELDPGNFRKNMLISRFHGWFEADGRGFSVTDRRETRGISVAGMPIGKEKPHLLEDGDEIIVGGDSARMTFRILEEDAPPGVPHAAAEGESGPLRKGGTVLSRTDGADHLYVLLGGSIRLDGIVRLGVPVRVFVSGGSVRLRIGEGSGPGGTPAEAEGRVVRLDSPGEILVNGVSIAFGPAGADDFKS